MRLRFQLRNGKSIRQRRKNEYVCISVKLSCLVARSQRQTILLASAFAIVLAFAISTGSDHPKFNGLITQYSSGLQ